MASTSKDKAPPVPEDEELPDLWTAAVRAELPAEPFPILSCYQRSFGVPLTVRAPHAVSPQATPAQPPAL